MPMELQLIRAQEFIRLGAHGHFDLEASKVALAQLAAACWKRGTNQALLDLRALHPGPKPIFAPTDLVALVQTFCEIGFTHQQRLAVLYGSDPHHRARLFAFLATLRGWNVQAFDNFEAAVTWLAGVGEPLAKTELTSGMEQVPVRQPKASKDSSPSANRLVSSASEKIPSPKTHRRSRKTASTPRRPANSRPKQTP